MRVVPVPVLSDNYAYLLIDEYTQEAVAVDPADPVTVVTKAQENGVTLSMVLTTHKHLDHAGGNNEIRKYVPGIDIVGGKHDDVQGCTKFVEDGEIIKFNSIHIMCLLTPGHTRGHICYLAQREDDEVQPACLFTGDCLFIGGAGKFFEGDGDDMYHSLFEKLGQLPNDTRVYCGHEYTLQNYRFARYVDSENEELKEAEKQAIVALNANKYTVPSTIGLEKRTNPFMRANISSIKVSVGLTESASTQESLQAIRDMKNNFL